jgi:hypothetical protein
MNEESIAHIQHVILLSHKEWLCVICMKVDGNGDNHVKWNKPRSAKQISHFSSNTDSRPHIIFIYICMCTYVHACVHTYIYIHICGTSRREKVKGETDLKYIVSIY